MVLKYIFLSLEMEFLIKRSKYASIKAGEETICFNFPDPKLQAVIWKWNASQINNFEKYFHCVTRRSWSKLWLLVKNMNVRQFLLFCQFFRKFYWFLRHLKTGGCSQNSDKIQSKCSQIAVKMQSKFSQNTVKIQSNCSQNAAKMLPKCSQNAV